MNAFPSKMKRYCAMAMVGKLLEVSVKVKQFLATISNKPNNAESTLNAKCNFHRNGCRWWPIIFVLI
jgi:hypothetical protein